LRRPTTVFLVIHRGESVKLDGPGRGRRGVALFLSPET
jgi:hypothetical protein